MKTIIGAIALVLAVPAAAQTAAPAANAHAGHHQPAPATGQHAGHDKAAHDCMAHCKDMMKKSGMKDCAEMMRAHQAKHGDGKGGDAHKDHKPSN